MGIAFTSRPLAVDDDLLFNRRRWILEIVGILVVLHHFREEIDVPEKEEIRA